MKIENLKPGMTVYDVHSYRMGNTTMKSIGVWHVVITKVEPESNKVFAKWNHNPERQYPHCVWSKCRLKKPELVEVSFGRHRLKTAKEKVAAKTTAGMH